MRRRGKERLSGREEDSERGKGNSREREREVERLRGSTRLEFPWNKLGQG